MTKTINQESVVQMNTPSVSIIIPTYNYGDYVRDAIGSALAQDYGNTEIIVVDDGSADSTAEIVAEFKNVTYIYQANSGVSSARNRGAQDASGEFLVFLDADDMMDETMISYLLPPLKDDPSVAISACRARFVDRSGNPLPDKELNNKFVGELTSRHFLISNRFPTGGALIRKSAFMACGGFDDSLVSTEDRDLWFRLSEGNKIILLPEATFTVRSHSDSLSMDADRAADHMDAFIRKSRASTIGKDQSAYFWTAVNAYRDCQTAWTLNAERKRWAAIRTMIRSILRCPVFPRQYVAERIFFRIRAIRIFIWRMVRT